MATTGTDKRNQLAMQAALLVPIALDKLHSADIALHDKKYNAVKKCIEDAKEYLNPLFTLFETACAELKEQEGGPE